MLSISQTTDEERPLVVNGVTIMCKPALSVTAIANDRAEYMEKNGIAPETYVDMSEEQKRVITGRILHRHYVTNISDFDVKDKDGKVIESFKHTQPSQHEAYETQGEQVLCTDIGVQESIIGFVTRDVNFKNGNEIVVAGN